MRMRLLRRIVLMSSSCSCGAWAYENRSFGGTLLHLLRGRGLLLLQLQLNRQWRAMRRCRIASPPVWRPDKKKLDCTSSRPGTAGRLIPPSDVLRFRSLKDLLKFLHLPRTMGQPTPGLLLWRILPCGGGWMDGRMHQSQTHRLADSGRPENALARPQMGSYCPV